MAPDIASGGNEAIALTNQNVTVSSVGVGLIGYEGLNDALPIAGSTSTGTQGKNNGGGNCSIIAYDGFLPMQ